MKKFLVAAGLILCFLLIPFGQATAADEELVFEWEQQMSQDFYGWKFWISETAGGPYAQFGEDIVYDGNAAPTYTATEVLTSPDGERKTYWFVVNAWGKNGKFSGNSNEVSYTVDFVTPYVPVTLTVKTKEQ